MKEIGNNYLNNYLPKKGSIQKYCYNFLYHSINFGIPTDIAVFGL